MTDFRSMVLRMASDHDQDTANALKWLMETPDADKTRVWEAIQETMPTATAECISRFAQWGMTELMLRKLREGAAE